VGLPELERQRDIARRIDAAQASIDLHGRNISKLRRARSGLAADLLSSRVRTVAV
jgi:restriction endonuclease S subunit